MWINPRIWTLLFFTFNILQFREWTTYRSSYLVKIVGSWIVMAGSYLLESYKQEDRRSRNGSISGIQSPRHNHLQCQGPLLKTARITY